MLVGYADGCIDACAVAGPNSFTALATIARQVNGPRLFAKYDVAAAPSAPNLSGKAAGTSNVLNWTAPDDHGSAITGYKLYRKVAGAAASRCSPRRLRTVTTYADSAITAGQSYTYHLTAVNASGESARVERRHPGTGRAGARPVHRAGRAGALGRHGRQHGRTNRRSDLQWVSVAEPTSIGAGNLEFIIKVADLSKPAANTTWPLQFKTPDGADHFVKMETDALGKVTFGYGDGTATTRWRRRSRPTRRAATRRTGRSGSSSPRSAFGIKPGDTLDGVPDPRQRPRRSRST